MILSYAEASAFATAIAQYMMLATLGPLIFVWAWRLISSYFDWSVPTDTDTALDSIDSIEDRLSDIQSAIEANTIAVQESRIAEVEIVA